jgi:hypothetical protein
MLYAGNQWSTAPPKWLAHEVEERAAVAVRTGSSSKSTNQAPCLARSLVRNTCHLRRGSGKKIAPIPLHPIATRGARPVRRVASQVRRPRGKVGKVPHTEREIWGCARGAPVTYARSGAMW